jgi:hypothetical protein
VLLPAAAITPAFVDGSQRALEIDSRSSYVPDILPWRLIALSKRRARTRVPRLEMPIWMK